MYIYVYIYINKHIHIDIVAANGIRTRGITSAISLLTNAVILNDFQNLSNSAHF